MDGRGGEKIGCLTLLGRGNNHPIPPEGPPPQGGAPHKEADWQEPTFETLNVPAMLRPARPLLPCTR